MTKSILMGVLVTVLFSFSSIGYTEDMVMVSPRQPDSPEGKFFTFVYTEAFKRLNLNFVYKNYPSKRCAVLSNAGNPQPKYLSSNSCFFEQESRCKVLIKERLMERWNEYTLLIPPTLILSESKNR